MSLGSEFEGEYHRHPYVVYGLAGLVVLIFLYVILHKSSSTVATTSTTTDDSAADAALAAASTTQQAQQLAASVALQTSANSLTATQSQLTAATAVALDQDNTSVLINGQNTGAAVTINAQNTGAAVAINGQNTSAAVNIDNHAADISLATAQSNNNATINGQNDGLAIVQSNNLVSTLQSQENTALTDTRMKSVLSVANTVNAQTAANTPAILSALGKA